MSEVILFTSGKGGVGKTTITANIGTGLAVLGKKTVVIDMDQGLRSTDIVLGLENMIVYNIYDALDKRCRISQTLVKDRNHEGLSLMPASQTKDQQGIKEENFCTLVAELKKHFDFVLIDGCSGIGAGFLRCLPCCDRVVLVVTPDVLSVRAADRVKGIITRNHISDVKLIVNRIRPEFMENGNLMSMDDIEDILGLTCIGAISEEEEILASVQKGETIAGKNSRGGQTFMRICRRIMGEKVAIAKFQVETTFFSKFRNVFWKV